jgi:hypothetical protein
MPESRPATPSSRPGTPAKSPPKAKASTAPTSAPTNGLESKESNPFVLDVPRLHNLSSEQQHQYLLTFTGDLVNHVEELSAEGINSEQAALKRELIKVVGLSLPAPTRVIRNNIGRCFAGIFAKGNRKPLYETINDLIAILNDQEKGKDKAVLRMKHAALVALGYVFAVAGDSAISLSPLACTTILKLIKVASNDTGLRAAVFQVLGRITKGIVVAIDEDIGRNIWKAARKAAEADKSLLVQQASLGCLEQLVRCSPYFDNSNDFEKLQAIIWKCIDSPCVPVRHAAASCIAAELVKSFAGSTTKDVVPKIRRPRKAKKQPKGEDPEDEAERASSPVPEKPATALNYTLLELLRVLSAAYCRPPTTNRGRAGIAVAYIKVLRALGESVVEQHYAEIARHFFLDILSHPAFIYGNKYRLLVSRRMVHVILSKVIGRMLGETGQLNAARFLLNDIIKDYPQAVRERPAPNKQHLIGALDALAALISDLDAAVGSIAETAREGLVQVLQHPSFTVQVYAARALRMFVLTCPQQMLPTVTICMNSVTRELNQLTSSTSTEKKNPRRCLGYAHGLAAVLSTSSHHPLYGSVDVYARVLSQATGLLKSAGSSDLRLSACQVQVAYIMLGGLMSLGPNFVKIHLSQLMLLWKNALALAGGQRSLLELSYLAHVRECALGSIKAFLTFNQRLLTSDVSRRLSGMLENTVSFVSGLPEKKVSDEPGNRLLPGLQLQDYESMVRRRVFQCFSQLLTLSPAGSLEATAHSTILPLAVASISDAEFYAPSSFSTSIAASAANFESIWDVGDNYGFGVTGLVRGLDVRDPVTRKLERHWSSRCELEDGCDRIIANPVGSGWEADGTSCYIPTANLVANSKDDDQEEEALPNPANSECVNSAIAALGLSLPLQPTRVQESILEQITSNVNATALQKDPARRAAITVNIALALLTACKVANGETGAARGELRHQATEKSLQALLHLCLKDTDESVRQIAAAAIGRLCASAGNAFTASEVTNLMETIVNIRDPGLRGSCALALANIHAQLGGMAAGFHMKSIVGMLLSLAADPHPLVHVWALDALAQVANSAGLNFSGHAMTTIGLLSQAYVSDSHNAEMASQGSSNMSLGLPVTAAIARGVDAVINVFGPDLHDSDKTREMIMGLVKLFSREDPQDNTGNLLESLRCLEHLSLYAPVHLDFTEYVQRLQKDMDSENSEIAQAALHGLFTVMRRDATKVVNATGTGLEERLWDLLNATPDQKQIRAIFTNWLQQTGPSDPAGWIQRCNAILTKTKSKTEQAPKTAPATTGKDTAPAVDLQDEEVAGFAAAAGVHKDEEAAAPSSTQELMKWQVRLFAMECLHELIAMISKEAAVSADECPGEVVLQNKVSDVIRIAFSASTAGVTSLRVVGMRIVDQILQMFGRTPDPDFPEAMLLEQYQAQISSALTPAFAADSSPELAAEAVNVCATFTATGIVTDIDRMGRILKLLVAALESFSRDAETASIGDLKSLSANAQVMVRMSVFAAWAQLQIASAEQKYLVDVVRPHIAQLVPQWLTSLREYSRLRFEPDISAAMTGGAVSGDLDTIYAALNRQTLLKFYQDSWLSLVEAIASLIDEDSEFVFDALDGKLAHGQDEDEEVPNGVNGIMRKSTGIDYREEPVAFFFVLFGLAFESLAARSSDDDRVTQQRNLDILRALKKILRPSVSGNAVYQEVVFSETMDLFDRMVLTESLGVQSIIVEIARNLCTAHPSSRQGMQTPINGETLSEDIEQLFELTRIIVLVIAGLVPGLSDTPVSARLENSDEAVSLVRTALQALVDVSDVFPSIIKTDLHATILHIFVAILGTGACQTAVVPQALPILRRFVVSIVDDERAETQAQLRNALARMMIILRNAQKRETELSLPCEKNTLLAITILLTAAPAELPETEPTVTRFVSELCESVEGPMTSRVAAGCIRTLLMANIATNILLPKAVDFLLAPSDLEGMDESKTIMAQTLSMYTAKVPPPQRPAAVALCISTFLGRAVNEGPKVHQETATRLLELAQADAMTFRNVVAGVEKDQRKILEDILKASAGARRKEEFGADHEPTIALKMDFGG